MVKEIIIPKENKAQIEEIREIENKELELQKKEFENKESKSTVATVAENAKAAVIPTVHASDKDDDDHDFEAKKLIEVRKLLKRHDNAMPMNSEKWSEMLPREIAKFHKQMDLVLS